MDLRTLLFLARKDLLKNWRVLLLVLVAVGSGALAIIPLNAMLNGFTASLTARTIDIAVGHVTVFPPESETSLSNVQVIVAEIGAMPEVRGVSPRLLAQAIASDHDRSEAVVIRGIDPVTERGVTTIAAYVTADRFLESRANEIVIGRTLADEPTANLDSATAVTVMDLLRKCNVERGQSIALVTHQDDWGARADRVIRLRDGKVV